MNLDAADLRDFYETPLGLVVRRLLVHRIRARWRPAAGMTMIGLGYAVPYLSSYRSESARLGAFMPIAQGALVWPRGGPVQSVLVESDRLPLPDNSVDRLLVVHGLEVAERVRPVLREIWRVMAPAGSLIMIVPNRRGLWARFDATPFGQGQPYSRGQLETLLGEALLTPVDWSYALHLPPLDRKLVLQWAMAFERMGARAGQGFGGVILVEAKKELLAPLGLRASARAMRGLITVPSHGYRTEARDGGSERDDKA